MRTLDVHAGEVAGRRFDLIVGADGAGSTVRKAMAEQVEGFTLAGEQAIAEFSRRASVHLGQRLTCSRLHGGRAALLGDAAAAFPPAGHVFGLPTTMTNAVFHDDFGSQLIDSMAGGRDLFITGITRNALFTANYAKESALRNTSVT